MGLGCGGVGAYMENCEEYAWVLIWRTVRNV